MRNFWTEANIEGRQTKLAGGPRAKDAIMDVTVSQRECGESVEVVEILCRPHGDKLVTIVNALVDGHMQTVATIESKR